MGRESRREREPRQAATRGGSSGTLLAVVVAVACVVLASVTGPSGWTIGAGSRHAEKGAAADGAKNASASGGGHELLGDNMPGGLPRSKIPDDIEDASSLLPVVWYAPFWSGGGYCSEAIAFVTELKKHTTVHIMHHGDALRPEFAAGLGDERRHELMEMTTGFRDKRSQAKTVTICHSEPGAWYPPKYQTKPCPDPAQDVLFAVGRTMFETDRLPRGWRDRLNGMDEVWVPTAFHRDVFLEGGVHKSRVAVVPEPVDTRFFSPATAGEPFPLGAPDGQFKFLSVFKWEERKGWRFLIEAFLREFTRADGVGLYILTNAYHSDADFASQLAKYAAELGLDRESLPDVHFLPEGIPTTDMPSVYKAADAFVLPSRGEGWGRPHAEAMSMALPVIATAWSGPTEFLSADNGYPLDYEGLESVPSGPFKGHMWARPSVTHLRQLMRHVTVERGEARQRGLRARKTMMEKYCPACVSKIVEDRLRIIRQKLVTLKKQQTRKKKKKQTAQK